MAILPTLITLGNAVFGLLAIYDVLQGEHLRAAWLILGSMVFDGLDGKVARATRSTSAFGSQLDSLCDGISFGVAPSVLVIALFSRVYAPAAAVPEFLLRVLVAVSLFYACAALVRLARFNVETSQDEASHQNFSGLPSPGAGGMIASWVITYFAVQGHPDWSWLAMSFLAALPVGAFFLGLLMVSRIRYTHVLNRLLRGFRPFTTLVEVALVLVLFAILHEVAIFVGFLGYVLTGPAAMLKTILWRRVPAGTAELHDEGVR